MIWVRTAAPTSEPISLTEAKLHLRRTSTHEDALITAMIKAAREKMEKHCWRAFVTQTWVLYRDQFPCIGGLDSDEWGSIFLPNPPLASVTSVQYVNTSGTTTSLTATTDYVVDTTPEPGRIYPAYGVSWPSVRDVPKAVIVTYVAGTAVNSVPEAIKHAMKIQLTQWYENRGDSKQLEDRNLHPAALALLDDQRVVEFA